MTENSLDYRLDTEYQEDYEARIPNGIGDPLSSDICARVGLPPNPEWESIINNEDWLSSVEMIDRLLEYDIPNIEKKKLRLERKKAVLFEATQSAWEETYNNFMEIPKAKLFLALREGKLTARGRHAAKVAKLASAEDWKDDNKLIHDEDYYKKDHVFIPSNCWRSEHIDWDASLAHTTNGLYVHILVDMKQLVALFPELEMQPATVLKIGDRYFLDNNLETHSKPIVSTRGRPSYPWDEFHVEVAKRLQTGQIPAKLEAWVADMQDWCEINWKKRVSRSMIHPKLSMYFDHFKKSKKSAVLSK